MQRCTTLPCSSILDCFFVLGCQRSGTTLLRLILEAHPDVVCYDEIKGYAILQSGLVENPSGARLVGFKLPRWTEQLTNPVLYDEGAEEHCTNFYRNEPILFMRRDVRDNIASMLKLKAGQSNWCELWVERIIKSKIVREASFRERYATEISIIQDSGSPLIGWAALYWKYKNDAFFDYSAAGLPVLAVVYENLVTDPRPVLQSVCRHLGIAFHKDLLRHHQIPHTELLDNGLAVGNSNPNLPIQADSIGQWERFLSKHDLSIIESIVSTNCPVRSAASPLLS